MSRPSSYAQAAKGAAAAALNAKGAAVSLNAKGAAALNAAKPNPNSPSDKKSAPLIVSDTAGVSDTKTAAAALPEPLALTAEDQAAANRRLIPLLLSRPPEVVFFDSAGCAFGEATVFTFCATGIPIVHPPAAIDPQVIEVLQLYGKILCDMCLSFHNVKHDEEGNLVGIICRSCRSRISKDGDYACPGYKESFVCEQTRWVDAMGNVSEKCRDCHKTRSNIRRASGRARVSAK